MRSHYPYFGEGEGLPSREPAENTRLGAFFRGPSSPPRLFDHFACACILADRRLYLRLRYLVKSKRCEYQRVNQKMDGRRFLQIYQIGTTLPADTTDRHDSDGRVMNSCRLLILLSIGAVPLAGCVAPPRPLERLHHA